MTDRPAPCHYDRALHTRVTRDHDPDCPRGTDCPADGNGCAPCPEPHCVICGREHTTTATPLTCPECIGKVRDDLTDIATAHADLAAEARDGGRDGRLVAAAPIPGGRAAVLIGPTVRLDVLRVSREMSNDHLRNDPIPPLAVLAQWEDIWRAWLDHAHVAGRASLTRAIGYLTAQVAYMAQQSPGDGAPDFQAFARQVRGLRGQLEHALHDEQEPELGVECFECGHRLVRRFRTPARCVHRTPARSDMARWLRLGYPEAVGAAAVRAARQPCGECDQGGISDPTAGLSWECLGCRKEYDPGEYATAVRRDLLENGADGDGWTQVGMAAAAASTLTGGVVLAGTVRKWVERGRVSSCCYWEPGRSWGSRLVFWPDVADAALDALVRAQRRTSARRVAMGG